MWSDYKMESEASPGSRAIAQWLKKRAETQWDPSMCGPGDFKSIYGHAEAWTEIVDGMYYGIERTFIDTGEHFTVKPLGLVSGCAVSEFNEDTEFDVIMVSLGDDFVGAIRAIRYLTGLGLKEAKQMADMVRVHRPTKVKIGIAKADAVAAVKVLMEAGVSAEIKGY